MVFPQLTHSPGVCNRCDEAREKHALRAARDEFKSWLDALESDYLGFADTHNITEDEARRAIALMRETASKL